jgi:hypothetical protein
VTTTCLMVADVTPQAGPLLPGDVVVVRCPWSIWGVLIRMGARMRGGLGRADHVAVVHHLDRDGTVHLIEGRPPGVGYATMTSYTLISSNAGQPKTGRQRDLVVAAATAALGTRYDWLAIASDALACLGVPQRTDTGPVHAPRRVVCSALANWCAYSAGLTHPGGPDEWATPDDWDLWCSTSGWDRTTSMSPRRPS